MLRFLLIMLLLCISPVLADDETQLYDPVAPPGSAFVRTLNNHITPYVPLPASEEYKEGQFYTLYKHRIFADPLATNRAKALVVFYNLTDIQNLSLKTADGSIAIVENVGALKNDSREINAVRIGFSVHDENGEVASLEEKALDRGSSYSVFAFDEGEEKVSLVFIRAETDTTQ